VKGATIFILLPAQVNCCSYLLSYLLRGITAYFPQVSKMNYIKWMQMNTNKCITIYCTWIALPS